MNYLIDKSLLLLYCMISLTFTTADSSYVIACLGAIMFSAFLYITHDRFFCTVLLCIFCGSICIFPASAVFLPLIAYDFFPPEQSPKNCAFSACSLIGPALALLGILYHGLASFFLFTGCVLSVFLRRKTDSYERLRHIHRQTMDNDTEIQLLLKEKNQSLLEKQDSEIYTATLRERNRIAREIHDNVGHMLTRSILMVGALKTINKEEYLKEPLNQLDITLNQAMNSIRQSVHDLHDSSVNLQDSLQNLIRDFSGCAVGLNYDMSPEIPRDVKYSFISIAKEALVNISKHSNADKASITALEHPGFYQFIIRDNGTDLPPFSQDPEGSENHGGIGLSNIRSRVKALNGNIQIQTHSGFCIYITVPKTEKTVNFRK